MRFSHLLLIGLVSSGIWICGCADRMAGGSEIGNPGSVAGLAVDGSGQGRAGVVLRLLASDYDPSVSGGAGDTLRAETDGQGRYLFPRVKTGSYVLSGSDPASGLRLLAEVKAEAKIRVEAGAAILRAPGRVIVEAGDSAAPGTYLYVPGTLIRAQVDGSGRALLDSVPAGNAVRVIRREGSTGGLRLDTVRVPESGAVQAFSDLPAAVGKAFLAAPGQDLQAAVDSLAAGDTLYLRGGIHYLEHLQIAVRGRPGARITIRNRPGETPVLRGTSPDHNLVDFNGAAYVDLEGLEVDSTMPGSDAFKFEDGDTTHHVALRNLHIHHIRGIAVNSQGDHHHIAVEGCHIHHTHGDPGTGIRIGDINGLFAPSDWTIQGNWIHHAGFETPDGSGAVHVFPGGRNIVIRDNTVHDNAYAGIRVFGLAGGNPSGQGLSLVEGNAVWNSGEGIGAYSDVVVRNNVVFACGTMLLSHRYEDGAGPGKPPENVFIHNNTWHGGGELVIKDWDSTRACVFANNAVYATEAPWILNGTGSWYGNVGDQVRAGFTPGTAADDLMDPQGRLFQPRDGSALIGKAMSPLLAERDFEGGTRDDKPDVGAYEYGYRGAERAIREGFKRP